MYIIICNHMNIHKNVYALQYLQGDSELMPFLAFELWAHLLPGFSSGQKTMPCMISRHLPAMNEVFSATLLALSAVCRKDTDTLSGPKETNLAQSFCHQTCCSFSLPGLVSLRIYNQTPTGKCKL